MEKYSGRQVILGVPLVIMDVNDIGGSMVVGKSCPELPLEEIEETMRYDNLLGQGTQQTPVGILRWKNSFYQER